MKFVLTGRDPIGQPDLTRKVVITPAFFSLTMDGFDGATGHMRFNRTVKVHRAFTFYHVVRPDSSRPNTRYTISGGSQRTRLELLVYDAQPYELCLTLHAVNDRNNDPTAIPGPALPAGQQVPPGLAGAGRADAAQHRPGPAARPGHQPAAPSTPTR